MKYMLLIFNNPPSLEAIGEDPAQLMEDADKLMAELMASGELVGGEALADPSLAKTVRVSGGAPAVTDGPFAEAKEHLAGYCLLDCATEERAIEIASRWPDARVNGVELRPLMTPDGLEM